MCFVCLEKLFLFAITQLPALRTEILAFETRKTQSPNGIWLLTFRWTR